MDAIRKWFIGSMLLCMILVPSLAFASAGYTYTWYWEADDPHVTAFRYQLG